MVQYYCIQFSVITQQNVQVMFDDQEIFIPLIVWGLFLFSTHCKGDIMMAS